MKRMTTLITAMLLLGCTRPANFAPAEGRSEERKNSNQQQPSAAAAPYEQVTQEKNIAWVQIGDLNPALELPLPPHNRVFEDMKGFVVDYGSADNQELSWSDHQFFVGYYIPGFYGDHPEGMIWDKKCRELSTYKTVSKTMIALGEAEKIRTDCSGSMKFLIYSHGKKIARYKPEGSDTYLEKPISFLVSPHPELSGDELDFIESMVYQARIIDEPRKPDNP